jgi:hypothetical protein
VWSLSYAQADSSGVSLPVDALLSAPGVTPTLVQLIRAADADGSGGLSVNELVKIFEKERKLTAEGRLLRK